MIKDCEGLYEIDSYVSRFNELSERIMGFVKQHGLKKDLQAYRAHIPNTPEKVHELVEKISKLAQKEMKTSVKDFSDTKEQRVPTGGVLEGEADSKESVGNGKPAFRWPLRGRVINNFGAKVSGAANDGIDLAAPEGTPVRAADDGVVAYAGNELKGYGNLVLVRHANGFVTAYANASELMVKRNEQVHKGQVIAKSGQTGTAANPQLHFEIRKNSAPVDPMKYLPADKTAAAPL
jgi:murein DD-endopeptidase MepM/ murein hydrolase activator NlpD